MSDEGPGLGVYLSTKTRDVWRHTQRGWYILLSVPERLEQKPGSIATSIGGLKTWQQAQEWGPFVRMVPEGFQECCPFDCDHCHGDDCPCDRLGCEGNPCD